MNFNRRLLCFVNCGKGLGGNLSNGVGSHKGGGSSLYIFDSQLGLSRAKYRSNGSQSRRTNSLLVLVK